VTNVDLGCVEMACWLAGWLAGFTMGVGMAVPSQQIKPFTAAYSIPFAQQH
jgi:hypothetical protein